MYIFLLLVQSKQRVFRPLCASSLLFFFFCSRFCCCLPPRVLCSRCFYLLRHVSVVRVSLYVFSFCCCYCWSFRVLCPLLLIVVVFFVRSYCVLCCVAVSFPCISLCCCCCHAGWAQMQSALFQDPNYWAVTAFGVIGVLMRDVAWKAYHRWCVCILACFYSGIIEITFFFLN